MLGRDYARLLLAAAARDRKALAGMHDAAIFEDEIVGFHLQQAVEKTLKAWLALLGEEVPRTHDMRYLLRLLEDVGQAVAPYWDLTSLSVFAVQLRYDVLAADAEALDRRSLEAAAGALFDHVSAKLL